MFHTRCSNILFRKKTRDKKNKALSPFFLLAPEIGRVSTTSKNPPDISVIGVPSQSHHPNGMG
jgi:hypothetical protein